MHNILERARARVHTHTPHEQHKQQSGFFFFERVFVRQNTTPENYYLRSISTEEWLAYPPKLTVELGSYVDGEAHGWAR